MRFFILLFALLFIGCANKEVKYILKKDGTQVVIRPTFWVDQRLGLIEVSYYDEEAGISRMRLVKQTDIVPESEYKKLEK